MAGKVPALVKSRRRIPIDVEEFLTKLGLRNVSRRADEVDFSCPFPEHARGDSSPSARMNAETTAWFCHGCGRKGTAVTFLAEHESVTIPIAQRWVREKWGAGQKTASPDEVLDELKALTDTIDQDVEHEMEMEVSIDDFEAVEDVLETWRYVCDRGFTLATAHLARICALKDPPRVIIPYFSLVGKCVGYKIRRIDPDAKPKYVNYYFKASKHLYLANEWAKITPNARDKIIVCEGELNALAMWQEGYAAVGISGSRLSDTQADLIGTLAGVNRSVYLVFDYDTAGIEGCYEAVEKLTKRLRPYKLLVAPYHSKDPSDLLRDGETQFFLINDATNDYEKVLTHG